MEATYYYYRKDGNESIDIANLIIAVEKKINDGHLACGLKNPAKIILLNDVGGDITLASRDTYGLWEMAKFLGDET